MASRDTGRLQMEKRPAFPVPPEGKKRVFILTSAQNNTGLHMKAWRNLLALADYERCLGALTHILVGTFTYSKATLAAKHAKRKTSAEGETRAEWWHKDLEDYIWDADTEIAPGLIWCGKLQILPTAVNPISGLESYTGRASSVIPASKFALTCVPSPKHAGTKFVYTTGAITLRNYIQKKAGQKAEFHHGYGALLVEVDDRGTWFARQLNADSDGVIYDLDRKVENEVVTTGHRPEAVVWGDIHEAQLEEDMRQLAWGRGGILDALQPRFQVFHDLIDFRAQNHHDLKDPWKMYAKHVRGQQDVAAEIASAARFLGAAGRDWCRSVVVCSNHDEALIRWLKEADFRRDPLNAKFFLKATLARYEALELGNDFFSPVAWAIWTSNIPAGSGGGLQFLARDEEFKVCEDFGGGIELGMHGDKGANGARSSVPGFARTGRKCITGHTHTAAIHEGAMSVGVMGPLDMGYNEGMSSWSHTNAIVYPNGKRTLFTIYRGKWRA